MKNAPCAKPLNFRSIRSMSRGRIRKPPDRPEHSSKLLWMNAPLGFAPPQCKSLPNSTPLPRPQPKRTCHQGNQKERRIACWSSRIYSPLQTLPVAKVHSISEAVCLFGYFLLQLRLFFHISRGG